AKFSRAQRLFDLDRKKRLHLVEKEAAVAVGAGDERFARVGRDWKGSLLERLGAVNQFLERIVVETAKDEHLAARQEGSVDLETGVLGGRSDERHRSVFDIGKKTILLRAVEAMDLVHEQQCVSAGLCGDARLGEDLLE